MSGDKDHLVPAVYTEGGQELLDNEEGWVIGVRGNRLLRFPTEMHMITMANTGGGKGVSVAIPNLLTHEGSVFSIEIGGTTYRETVNFRRHVLKQDVHVIDPLGATGEPSAKLNLMDTLDPSSKSFYSDVFLFAKSILKSSEGTKEQSPYFERTPVNLLVAFLLHVKLSPDIEEEDRNLITVSKLLSTYPSQEWHDLMRGFSLNASPYSDAFHETGNYFYGKDDENKASIVSSVTSALGFAKDPTMKDILSESTFSLSDLRNKKSTIYVVMPEAENYQTYATWLRLLVERSFAACPNLGDGGRNFAHNDRVLFMLDEFTQLGKLDVVDNGMQTARQKGITIWAEFQDFERLKIIYREEIANSFLGAAAVIQAFHMGERNTNKLISDELGKKVVYIPSVQHGESWGESDQKNWSESKSLGTSEVLTHGESVSDAENWSDTESRSKTSSFGISETTSTSHTFGTATTTGGSSLSGRSGSVGVSGDVNRFLFWDYAERPSHYNVSEGVNSSETRSHSSTMNESTTRTTSTTFTTNTADTVGQSHTIGGARTVGRNKSKAVGKNEQDTQTVGGGFSQSRGGTYSVSYQPHILPQLDPSEVKMVLGSDNNQILLIRAKNTVLNLIDQRANFFEVPMLMRRAKGPEVFEPPMMIGHLEEPKQLTYQPAITINLAVPETVEITVGTLSQEELTPLTSRKSSLGGYSPADYAKAREKAARADNLGLAKARQKQDRVFLGAAQAIEAESLDIAGTFDKTMDKVERRWARIEAKADDLARHRQTLLDAREKLDGKAKRIAEFEGVLTEYRQTLLDDLEYEDKYKTATERYQVYLAYIHELRTGWTEIQVPERPEALKRPEYRGEISPTVVKELIGPEIPKLSGVIPHIPATPENPRNKDVPDITLAMPATDLKRRGVKLKDGQPRTVADLDSEIARKGGIPARILRNLPLIGGFFDKGPTLAELKQARQNLVVNIQDRTHRILDDNSTHQRAFQRWLNADNKYAAQYVEDLDVREETLRSVAEQLKRKETAMDTHWDDLERRLTDMNTANRILETRRVKIYNGMMHLPEWDQLEAQTALIESQKPEPELLEAPEPEQPERRGQSYDDEQDMGDDERISYKPDDPDPTMG